MIAGAKDPPGGLRVRPALSSVLSLVGFGKASDRGSTGASKADPAFFSGAPVRVSNRAVWRTPTLWSERSAPDAAPNSQPTDPNSENAAVKYARCVGRGAELKAALLGRQRGWLGGDMGSRPAYFDRIKGTIKSMEAVPGSTRVRVVIENVNVYAFSDTYGFRTETGDETFLRLDAGSHDLFCDVAGHERRRIKGAGVDIGPDGTIALTFDSEEQLRSIVSIHGDFRHEICN